MVHRMAEQGVPLPYSRKYRASKPQTKAIIEYLDETVFWTPFVPNNYNRWLFAFWFGFGYVHTQIEKKDPFEVYN
jgi:hypothetical protein